MSPAKLMDFRNYLFSPTYITHNAGQFLNDEWVDIGLFREYLRRTAQGPVSDAVPKHSSPASGPVRVKTEAPVSLIPAFVKAEPEPVDLPHASGDIKLRTLNEDGHEIFELLSDSDAGEDHDSDQEVIEALRRTSRSSSAIPPSVADDVNDDIEVVKSGGGPPHPNFRRKVDSDVAQEIEMSLSTGVLANPNNEMSNRIARSSQRRSAAARKASESREAEDLSKEIRLQIDASTARTKELRAQLKASKSSSTRNAAVVLSASSSGRVRSARRRTEVPVVEQALNNALPPATESAFDFPNWDVAMGTTSLENPTFPPQAGSSTSVDPVLSGGQTTYGFDTLLPYSAPALGADDFEDFLNAYGLTSSPSLFGDGATLGNSYLDPFFISSHCTADDSANSSAIGPLAITPSTSARVAAASFPTLSPAVQKSSESAPSAPKSRRLRSEVDPALILPATSTRSRVPSSRKRNADDDTSERPQKKGKGRANQVRSSSLKTNFCLLNPIFSDE
ncbi:hypothetical protein K438DRAFT_2005604 [Mycena galopus ATCC 62051]|nr:hypothetical protein K438DRAFT_2005604 [Mycena galopus ATCC 62051]